MPRRPPLLIKNLDCSQHNARIQVSLANTLRGLGFDLPAGIHPGTTPGTDIVVQWPGKTSTIHIEVEIAIGGGLGRKVLGWVKKLNACPDAKALVVVITDAGWARTVIPKAIKGQPMKPVHCVGLEDWGHLVPVLACHYLL